MPHRYLGLVLAGLRPGQDRLPSEPPRQELLRRVAQTKPERLQGAGSLA